MTAQSTPQVLRYGPDPSQYAELYLPDNETTYDVSLPVAVVIHGGFWRQRYGIELARPLAADLAASGVAALAVEYRRWGAADGSGSDADDGGRDGGSGGRDAGGHASDVGGDTAGGTAGGTAGSTSKAGDSPGYGTGGWPRTLEDVAAAVDALARWNQNAAQTHLDLTRVVAVGHSAGGQLAAWLAHRSAIPAGAPCAAVPDSVLLRGAVSQAGVLDLAHAEAANLGDGAIASFMGASASEDPARYRHASPISYVGDGARVICVHGEDDDTVPLSQSEQYVAAARTAGDEAEIIALPGVGHMELIDPAHPAWAVCRDKALALIAE